MRFPIDVEEKISEFRAYSPENEGAETVLRVCIPMLNAAYRQGQRDAETSQGGRCLFRWRPGRRRNG